MSPARDKHIQRVLKMVENERRKYARKKSLNLVDYVLLDEEGNPISRGMGRTRNVCEGGLLLETPALLKDGHRLLITVGLEEDLMAVKGRVIYSKPSEGSGFWAGVEFLEIDMKGREVLKPYIMGIETGEEE